MTQIMKLSEAEKEVLDKELGADMTAQIVAQANAQGKDLEAQNIAFKSEPSTFTKETLLLLGAIKTLTQGHKEAKKELAEYRKEVKDLGNQVANLLETFGGTIDTNKRTQESVASLESSVQKLIERRPAASRSSATEIDPDDTHADFLERKNNEDQEARIPIVSQMKTMPSNGGPS